MNRIQHGLKTNLYILYYLFSVIISYIDDINGYNKKSMYKCIKYYI